MSDIDRKPGPEFVPISLLNPEPGKEYLVWETIWGLNTASFQPAHEVERWPDGQVVKIPDQWHAHDFQTGYSFEAEVTHYCPFVTVGGFMGGETDVEPTRWTDEKPTNLLQWSDGKLQQQWSITQRVGGGGDFRRFEWRDVPTNTGGAGVDA
jgi:hypothetical protein